MADKRCPFCGNPELKMESRVNKSGDEALAGLCAVCKKQTISPVKGHGFLIEDISDEERDRMFNPFPYRENLAYLADYDRDWKNYTRGFNDSEGEWEIFLFKKNENNKTVIDISEENLQKCQRIYDDHPDDENNLLRLLILKIFADKNYKDLASKFLVLWKQRKLTLWPFVFFIYEATEETNRYMPKFRSFLLWLKEVNFSQFKEETNEEHTFFCFCKMAGMDAMAETVDAERLLFENFDFRWDDEYLKFYALAKFFYSESRWREAFCLFEKLHIYNKFAGVTDDELSDLDIREYDEVLHLPPTLKDIEHGADDSFSRIDFSDSSEREVLRILLHNFYVGYWRNEEKIQKKDAEIDNYLKLYTVFTGVLTDLAGESYESAFNRWVDWDKGGQRMLGLDTWETTRFLRDIRDGVGDRKKLIENFRLSHNVMAIVADPNQFTEMESRLREIIQKNLTSFYGPSDAWTQHVPDYIRRNCQSKAGQSAKSELPQWAFLSIFDCVGIVRTDHRLINVFLEHFPSKGSTAQQRQYELLDFLDKIKNLRNVVVHGQRVLNDAERNDVKLATKMINEIYEHNRPGSDGVG